MLQQAGLYVRDEIQLVIEKRFGAVRADLVARHLHGAQRSRGCYIVKLRFGDKHVAGVICIPELITNRNVGTNIVLHLRCSDIVIGSQVVTILETIVVTALNGSRLIE